MDEVQCVGLGMALGILVISILTVYPGKPLQCSTESVHSNKNEELAMGSSSKSPTNSENGQLAAVDKANQRLKVDKLQQLLLSEKKKTQQLMKHAHAKVAKATEASKPFGVSSQSFGSKSAWFDCIFLLFLSALFVIVLQYDYNINVLSIIAHLFPREAKVFRQLATALHNCLLHVYKLG